MYDDYSYGMDASLLLGAYLFMGIFIIISYIVTSWLLSTVYKKMDEDAWKAWVPVYNTWVFFERGGFHGALSLLVLASVIPIIGGIASITAAVLSVIAAYNIGRGFGKDGVWAVLYLFVAPVWAGILGLGKSVYNPALNPKDRKYTTAGAAFGGQNYPSATPSYAPPAAPAAPTTVEPETGYSNGYLPAEREVNDNNKTD